METWHLNRHESLYPSPNILRRHNISDAPLIILASLVRLPPTDLGAPCSRVRLSLEGDELEIDNEALERESSKASF